MTDTTYNGWTNRETWLANLWLGETDFLGRLQKGDILDLGYADMCSLEETIAEELDFLTEGRNLSGLAADLYNGAVGGINLRELAKTYAEGLEIDLEG